MFFFRDSIARATICSKKVVLGYIYTGPDWSRSGLVWSGSASVYTKPFGTDPPAE